MIFSKLKTPNLIPKIDQNQVLGQRIYCFNILISTLNGKLPCTQIFYIGLFVKKNKQKARTKVVNMYVNQGGNKFRRCQSKGSTTKS